MNEQHRTPVFTPTYLNQIAGGITRPQGYLSLGEQLVIYAGDASESMDEFGKSVAADSAMRGSTEELAKPPSGNQFKIAVIHFNDKAEVVNDFTTPAKLLPMLTKIRPSGSTSLASALYGASALLSGERQRPNIRQGHRPVVVFFTDGANTTGRDPIVASNHLQKEHNALVLTVAFGPDASADIAMLRAIASCPQLCVRVDSGAELRKYFANFGSVLHRTVRFGQNAAETLATMNALYRQ